VRVLVTGGTGFVATHALERLAAGAAEVHATHRPGNRPGDTPGVHWHALQLEDGRATAATVREVAPDRVLHLAALADPRACEEAPARALEVNAGGTAAVLAGLAGSGARALVVSTAQVYGASAEGYVGEDAPLRPLSAYGRSKRVAERVAERFAERGLAVSIARPFNHSGRGQGTGYVLPALTAQLREAAASGARTVGTGNLWPRRDFLHVDDVLEAYDVLLERGERGRAYNVCSGEARSVGEVLEALQVRLGTSLEPVPDPARVRPGEAELLAGDPGRLRALGWEPRHDLGALLDDVVAGARAASS
jgi:GDP-4-dehydro-6-deoxy-D-mannose reductase